MGAVRMSAASWLEATMVIDQRGDAIAKEQFEASFHVVLTDVTKSHAIAARAAWSRFGKDSGHHAQLNFGGCIALATASEAGEALLFKGRCFVHTDVEPALKD